MGKKPKPAKRGEKKAGKPARAKGGRKAYTKPEVEATEPATEEHVAAAAEPAADEHAANSNGASNGASQLPPPPEGTKRVFKPLPCPLSAVERERLRAAMHDAETEITKLKEQRKSLNETIESKRGELHEAAVKSKSGVEHRTVECLLVPSYSENCMRTVRTDVAVDDPARDHPYGHIVSTRPLEASERTGNLFDSLPNEQAPEPAVDADDEAAMKALAEQSAAAENGHDAEDAADQAVGTDDELGPASEDIGDEFDEDDDSYLDDEEAGDGDAADGGGTTEEQAQQ